MKVTKEGLSSYETIEENNWNVKPKIRINNLKHENFKDCQNFKFGSKGFWFVKGTKVSTIESLIPTVLHKLKVNKNLKIFMC